MTAVYNDYISSRLGGAQSTKFTTTFEYVDNDGNDQTISTEGKNLNISKLYVITTGRSASASECLICGLKPYMDLKLFGEQTSGKYCGGSVYEGSKWYNDVRRDMENKGKSELYKKGVVEAENWGIYVMLSRYADKNGRTISMPDGITPDIKTSDNPTAMVQLGDPSEPMLAKVLEHAGYIKKAATTHAESISEFTPTEKQPDLPGWGIMIIDQ